MYLSLTLPVKFFKLIQSNVKFLKVIAVQIKFTFFYIE